jgi:hypothetical protein
MYDGIRNYFVECVLADHDVYVDYRATKQAGLNVDLRLAVHACSSMLNLADHVFEEMKAILTARSINKLRDYHSHLERLCPEFKIIRDCANAHKHRRLTKHNPCISGAESIEEAVVITEYVDEDGPYRIAEKEVHVSLLDGTTIVLHEALKSVRKMWWDEMTQLGVMQPRAHAPSTPGKQVPIREQLGESAFLQIKIRKGERFKQKTLIRKFNYQTMSVEPIDLTGCSAKMTMRAAPDTKQP